MNKNQETQLKIYTLEGELVSCLSLASGTATLQEDLSNLADGIFVYELTDGEHRSAGKISMF